MCGLSPVLHIDATGLQLNLLGDGPRESEIYTAHIWCIWPCNPILGQSKVSYNPDRAYTTNTQEDTTPTFCIRLRNNVEFTLRVWHGKGPKTRKVTRYLNFRFRQVSVMT